MTARYAALFNAFQEIGVAMEEGGPPENVSPSFLDDEFAREALVSGKPVTHSDRRRTIRRALLAVGGCILLAAVVLTATGTAGQLVRQGRFAWLQHNAPTITRATIAPQPAARRALPGGWQPQPPVTLPNPNISWYTSAPNDPDTLYACSAAQADKYGATRDGPLVFWYSHDAGQRWSSAPIPHASATYCNVSVASDAPQRLALISQYYGSVPSQDAACSQLSLFLSDDGGALWHTVPSLPDPPIQPVRHSNCTVIPWVSTHHLYLLYTYSVMTVTKTGNKTTSAAKDGTSLARSDDGGKTWKTLDADLPPGIVGYFSPDLLDDGETLLLPVNQYDPPANGKPEHEQTWLWVSHDAGDRWEPLATINGLLIQTALPLADARSLAPSPAHPLYLVSAASMPSRYLRIQVAQMTDLDHWTPLPPLPIAGANPEHLGITSILTTTPSGRLLVFGLGPNGQIPSSDQQQVDEQQFNQQWLWEWDPVASRWTLLTPALDMPWPQCGDHCWRGWITSTQDSSVTAGSYLWVKEYDHASLGRWKTFRIPYIP